MEPIRVVLVMSPRMVVISGLRKPTSVGWNLTVNSALGLLAPIDVECREPGVKRQPIIWQMIVNPPCECLPVAGGLVVVDEAVDDDTGCTPSRPS